MDSGFGGIVVKRRETSVATMTNPMGTKSVPSVKEDHLKAALHQMAVMSPVSGLTAVSC